jgi:GntR family transcriptional regulator
LKCGSGLPPWLAARRGCTSDKAQARSHSKAPLTPRRIAEEGFQLFSPFKDENPGVESVASKTKLLTLGALIRRSGMGAVEFYIDKHSSVPVIAQIKEQIKLAVAMGIIRNGDKLPSIREVEKQTGVNRGKIYRAYISLKQSGLLVLSPGQGAVVLASSPSPSSANQKCLQLSKSIIQRARQYGIPPIVFARFLSRQAQEAECSEPFIAFVDDVKEVAERRAGEISRLWQIPVIGMTILQLKASLRKGSVPRIILATHLRRDYVRSMISSKKIDVIPIEVAYTGQTIKELAKIKANSSVLRVLAQPYVKNARFIIAQLKKRIKAPGVKISWAAIRDLSYIEPWLNSSQYDRIIVDPGIVSALPDKILRNPRTMLVRLQLSPASLEAARILSGVII